MWHLSDSGQWSLSDSGALVTVLWVDYVSAINILESQP